MNFRQLCLIGEAFFWLPVVVLAETAFYVLRMVRGLIDAFRDEWHERADRPSSLGMPRPALPTTVRALRLADGREEEQQRA